MSKVTEGGGRFSLHTAARHGFVFLPEMFQPEHPAHTDRQRPPAALAPGQRRLSGQVNAFLEIIRQGAGQERRGPCFVHAQVTTKGWGEGCSRLTASVAVPW